MVLKALTGWGVFFLPEILAIIHEFEANYIYFYGRIIEGILY